MYAWLVALHLVGFVVFLVCHAVSMWVAFRIRSEPDRAVIAFAMGCDMVAMAREVMMATGCIQSLQCHTGHCPTGVATMDPWLQRGLVVDDKAKRVAKFIQGFRKEILALPHTLADVADEASVREIVTDLNHRIAESHRRRLDGPPIVIGP